MPYLGINTDGVKISLIFWTVPVVVIGGCFGASALGRTPLGDMNCDGVIDFADINPFVMALTDPNALRAQVGDDCFLKEQADCNFDGTVDFADIDPFVDFIMGTAVPPNRPPVIHWFKPIEEKKETYVAKCKMMACGHPQCCIACGDEGTNHCGWCEAAARAKHDSELAEYWRHRCIDMQASLARIAREAVNRDIPTREQLELTGVLPPVPDALGDADHS